MINREDAVFEELRFCPFGLVPGANGRVLMWWREEKTWIAALPSLQAAHDFIIGFEEGSPGWHRNPGWDRSDTSIDLKRAVYEYREKNGKFPQFEFSESSNVFDLYMPLGLGPEALSRLIYHDAWANWVDIYHRCVVPAHSADTFRWWLGLGAEARRAHCASDDGGLAVHDQALNRTPACSRSTAKGRGLHMVIEGIAEPAALPAPELEPKERARPWVRSGADA